MFNTELKELAPPGGFPRQRIRNYGVDIIPPPSVYNMYSDVSRLPVYEMNFNDQIDQVRRRVAAGVPRVSEGGEGIGALHRRIPRRLLVGWFPKRWGWRNIG